MGLLSSLRRYGHPDEQFGACAAQRIRGAVLDELRELDWRPRRLRQKSHKINDAIRELTRVLGRTPSFEDLNAHLSITAEEYHEYLLLDCAKTLESFDDLLSDVYLAELQLFLLDPARCHHVAESLGRANLTFATLLEELQPQQQVKPQADESSVQLAELQKIREEIAALRPLMEQQKLALQQLRLTAKSSSTAAPERDNVEVSKVDAPVEKMQKIRQKGIF